MLRVLAGVIAASVLSTSAALAATLEFTMHDVYTDAALTLRFANDTDGATRFTGDDFVDRSWTKPGDLLSQSTSAPDVPETLFDAESYIFLGAVTWDPTNEDPGLEFRAKYIEYDGGGNGLDDRVFYFTWDGSGTNSRSWVAPTGVSYPSLIEIPSEGVYDASATSFTVLTPDPIVTPVDPIDPIGPVDPVDPIDPMSPVPLPAAIWMLLAARGVLGAQQRLRAV